MIVSFNFYYSQPGQQDAVLRQRLRACEVRQNIGIARGRVLARTAGAADLPDVIWEQHFEDVAGHHADMARRAASPEFESVRAGMRKLIRRFERPLFEICVATGPATAAASDPGMVVLDWIFCAPGKPVEALELQQHAHRGSGGSRLLRLITPGSDLPDFVRQRDYVDAGGRDPALAQGVSRSEPPAVDAFPGRVEHSVWKVM